LLFRSEAVKKPSKIIDCVMENVAVMAFREKMATDKAQVQYRGRSRVAEFCRAWVKCKLGLKQFHVRGLLKVQIELLWACLTCNIGLA
jgi:hypothetical protein